METTQPVTAPVLKACVAELRSEVRSEASALRSELRTEVAKTRAEIADTKSEMRHHIYATSATHVVLLLGILYLLINHAK